MLKFKTQILPISLVAAAVLATGGGFAALAATAQQHTPPHAAADGDPAILAMHNELMSLAAQLAHGGDHAEIRPKMLQIAAAYSARTGEDRKAMEDHLDEMARQIIAAREKGPEALHTLMTSMFGDQH